MANHPATVKKLFLRILKVCEQEFTGMASAKIIENSDAVGVSIQQQVQIVVMAHTSGCMIASCLGLCVPKERESETNELIRLVNRLSLAGSLEIAAKDNQLRLRHCIYAPCRLITSALITAAVRANYSMARQATRKLKAFLGSEQSGQQAADQWLWHSSVKKNLSLHRNRIGGSSSGEWPPRATLN